MSSAIDCTSGPSKCSTIRTSVLWGGDVCASDCPHSAPIAGGATVPVSDCPCKLYQSLYSGCHGWHHVWRLVGAAEIHRRAGVRSEIPSRFRCCLSQNVPAGLVHDEGSGLEILAEGGITETCGTIHEGCNMCVLRITSFCDGRRTKIYAASCTHGARKHLAALLSCMWAYGHAAPREPYARFLD